jgi:chaperonin GroEL (HSP60 family)
VPLELTRVINLIYFFSPQGAITNMLEENVVQPLLVSTSAITLASETVRSILKIDDIVSYMGDCL